MQIVSVAYTTPEQDQVSIVTDERTFHAPWPIRSWHREFVQAWLDAGNEITAYAEPEVPVPSASPLQLFDELDQVHGIDLETEIGAVSAKALRRFRLAQEIKPTDQFSLVLQNRLGWTDAQREALFRAAAARS